MGPIVGMGCPALPMISPALIFLSLESQSWLLQQYERDGRPSSRLQSGYAGGFHWEGSPRSVGAERKCDREQVPRQEGRRAVQVMQGIGLQRQRAGAGVPGGERRH